MGWQAADAMWGLPSGTPGWTEIAVGLATVLGRVRAERIPGFVPNPPPAYLPPAYSDEEEARLMQQLTEVARGLKENELEEELEKSSRGLAEHLISETKARLPFLPRDKQEEVVSRLVETARLTPEEAENLRQGLVDFPDEAEKRRRAKERIAGL